MGAGSNVQCATSSILIRFRMISDRHPESDLGVNGALPVSPSQSGTTVSLTRTRRRGAHVAESTDSLQRFFPTANGLTNPVRPTASVTLFLLADSAHAGPRTSANYSVLTDTADAGGKRKMTRLVREYTTTGWKDCVTLLPMAAARS